MSLIPKDVSSSSRNPFAETAEEDVQAQQQLSDLLQTETGQFVRQLVHDISEGEFDLPPFPDTALRVQECIRDEHSDVATLARIVATEPALAARLMRMANSAALRRGPFEVTDIPTAIMRVGLDMVMNVAVSFAARDTFKVSADGLGLQDVEKLRKTSVRVGAIAYILARSGKSAQKPEEAMLAGLLHSVGKFYILTKAGDYPELFAHQKALNKLMADWHSGVARAIVESWQFPDTVAHAVDEQEVRTRDRKAPPDLSDILYIANVLGRTGLHVAPHLGDLDALARLNFDAEDIVAILSENADDLQSMIDAMQ